MCYLPLQWNAILTKLMVNVCTMITIVLNKLRVRRMGAVILTIMA